jgi:hypothetical protein
MPNDLPPVAPPTNTVSYLPLKALARTYRRLQKKGPRDFCEGERAISRATTRRWSSRSVSITAG